MVVLLFCGSSVVSFASAASTLGEVPHLEISLVAFHELGGAGGTCRTCVLRKAPPAHPLPEVSAEIGRLESSREVFEAVRVFIDRGRARAHRLCFGAFPGEYGQIAEAWKDD